MDKDILVRGQVTGKNIEPLAYDGDGILNVYVGNGEEIVVHFPSGESICHEDTNILEEIKNGDTVEILGRLIGKDEMTVCDAGHYVKIVTKMNRW